LSIRNRLFAISCGKSYEILQIPRIPSSSRHLDKANITIYDVRVNTETPEGVDLAKLYRRRYGINKNLITENVRRKSGGS